MSEFKERPSYEIQKVKIKSEKAEVEYKEVFHDSNYRNDVVKKCDNFIHQDLKYVLGLLKPHVAAICEMKEAGMVDVSNPTEEDINELDNYIITGYTKGGNDEGSGVCIIAQKILQSGQVLNLTTPFTKFEGEAGEGYPYGGELKNIINRLDYEVDAYLFEEKWGMKQLSLDFDEPDSSEPKEPKRRGRKKKEAVEGFEAAVQEVADVEFEEAS